jgi:hypothetical protein
MKVGTMRSLTYRAVIGAKDEAEMSLERSRHAETQRCVPDRLGKRTIGSRRFWGG